MVEPLLPSVPVASPTEAVAAANAGGATTTPIAMIAATKIATRLPAAPRSENLEIFMPHPLCIRPLGMRLAEPVALRDQDATYRYLQADRARRAGAGRPPSAARR